jgi:hypothetical protein
LLVAVVHVAVASARPAERETRGLCPFPPPRAAAAAEPVHDGAWSYFGDPRVIAHGDVIFAGCVSTRGEIVVHQYDRRNDRAIHIQVGRNPEVDDHDNPSVEFWDNRLWAFYSPHSGHTLPLTRRSAMHYRASLLPYDISGGFGPEHEVRTNTRGGLGFTYPNPVAVGNKLWLFWRGGDWNPTVSYTRDGIDWVKARTLVVGRRGQRPYAKYVAGPDGSIHMFMSDGLPATTRTSLYYMRYQAGRFYRADGSQIGTMLELPLPVSQLDPVYRFSAAVGRAWPHDIALDAGSPIVLYTGRIHGPNGDDTFYYGRWTGSEWSQHAIVPAGRKTPTFKSGGATFDHAKPSRLVLSRRIGRWFQVELWRTPDAGQTWLVPIPVTAEQNGNSFRPVIPRSFYDPSAIVVYYVYGNATSFRSFQTRIDMTQLAPGIE